MCGDMIASFPFENRSSVRHFFMVPPGEAASPFLSTAPPVPAPCVLASFDDGLVVVLLFILSPAVAFEAGPPVCALLPAALPCARVAVLTSARAAASEMHFIFIFVSRPCTPHQSTAATCIRS